MGIDKPNIRYNNIQTLDAHLKRYYYRDIANWIVVLLRDAGLIDIEPGPPLRLRLKR